MRYHILLLNLWLLGCASSEEPPLYHRMDKADVTLANHAVAEALQTRARGQSLTWANPANQHSGSVTPLRTFIHPAGKYCRDYREQLHIGSASQQWQDTACREKDGSWHLLRS